MEMLWKCLGSVCLEMFRKCLRNVREILKNCQRLEKELAGKIKALKRQVKALVWPANPRTTPGQFQDTSAAIPKQFINNSKTFLQQFPDDVL